MRLIPASKEATSRMLSENSLKREKNQNFLADLSNSGPAVRRYSEGKTAGPAEDHYRRRQCRNIWLLSTIPTATTVL